MDRLKYLMWLLIAPALMASGWGAGPPCDTGCISDVPKPYEGSVDGAWRLDYEPAEVLVSDGGDVASGELGVMWNGSSISPDCRDVALLCPREVLGDGDGLWRIEEMDPSELLFDVAVPPHQCTRDETAAAGEDRCGTVLLPVVERTPINMRLGQWGSMIFSLPDFLIGSESEQEFRACHARVTVYAQFDELQPRADDERPQAQRVTGEVTTVVDAGCLLDEQGDPFAPIGAETELQIKSTFSGVLEEE